MSGIRPCQDKLFHSDPDADWQVVVGGGASTPLPACTAGLKMSLSEQSSGWWWLVVAGALVWWLVVECYDMLGVPGTGLAWPGLVLVKGDLL